MFEPTESLSSVYNKFMSDKSKSELTHNILDLTFNSKALQPSAENLFDEEDVAARLGHQYAPKNGFFD